MRPVSNQSARFTEGNKCWSTQVTSDNRSNRYLHIYNASKVIAKDLKSLVKNEYKISDTLTFPDLVKNAFNSNEYEDVSYDVQSLFKSIPVEDTINYIVDRIYVRK